MTKVKIMPVKKKAAKKRKYVKKNKTIIELPTAIENSELVDVILYAVDRLGISDKAKIFTRILGTDEVSEQQLWAITKLLG